MNRTILLLGIILFCIGCSDKTKKSIQTTKVKKGTFDVEVIETGEVSAVKAINISSPAMSWRYGMLKIHSIVDEGTEVKKDDVVITFDPSEVNKTITSAQTDIEIAQAELQKKMAEQEQKLQDLEADLKTAKINLEISQIELELASYESDIKKKEIQLNLDKAKLDLEKAGQIIINQKKINIEDINQAKLKISQQENNMKEAKNTLEALSVKSPADGIALLRNNWSTSSKWKAGDQTWSGNALIDLPYLKKLKILLNINEVDISKIKINQTATIKLDAFADSSFTGSVMTIASLAKTKEEEKSKRIKVFPVEILVNGSSKLLMPGMTVSVKISVNKISDVLSVPLQSLFKKDNDEFVYVSKGTGFEKTSVVTGMINNDFVVIAKGLSEGDVVALSDPTLKDKEDKNQKKAKK